MTCTYTARKHDALGIRHLLQRPMGGLFADPGVGKTGMVLATAQVLKKRKLVDKVLVMAPLNPAYEVWGPEIDKWGFSFTHGVLHDKHRKTLLEERDQDGGRDVYAINYDGMAWLAENIQRLIKRGEKWWLVLDESTKVKHTNTKRFKLLKPMLPLFVRRTILTGTPIPNGLIDLFGQVYAVDLGASLGRYVTQYRREFFYPSGYGGYTWMPQADAEKRIYARLGDAFLRIDDSVLDLPPLHDVPLYVALPPKARKVYKDLEEEFVAELQSGTVTAVNAGVLSGKLRQVANGSLYGEQHKAHHVHDAKVEAVGDLLEQLGGSPLLIGYEFTADGERLAEEYSLPIVNGSTSRADKTKFFAEFNQGKHPGLVVQSSAAAHGLNLQKACHTVALFGLTWNLEVYAQFKKRVHRGGQQSRVICHHIIARNTIDELVWQVLRQKDRKQAALLAAVKRRYTK